MWYPNNYLGVRCRKLSMPNMLKDFWDWVRGALGLSDIPSPEPRLPIREPDPPLKKDSTETSDTQDTDHSTTSSEDSAETSDTQDTDHSTISSENSAETSDTQDTDHSTTSSENSAETSDTQDTDHSTISSENSAETSDTQDTDHSTTSSETSAETSDTQDTDHSTTSSENSAETSDTQDTDHSTISSENSAETSDTQDTNHSSTTSEESTETSDTQDTDHSTTSSETSTETSDTQDTDHSTTSSETSAETSDTQETLTSTTSGKNKSKRKVNRDYRRTPEKQPWNIGPKRNPQNQPLKPPKLHSRPVPELICQKQAKTYEIKLNVEGCDVDKVRQNETDLHIDGASKYLLSDYSGYLEITYKDGKKSNVTLFDGDRPLIFKLRENWEGIGRHRKGKMTRGCFLVFAPSDWEYDGTPPVEPVYCSVGNFRIHYIVLYDDDDAPPKFRKRGGAPYELPTNHAIELPSEQPPIFDDSSHGKLHTGDVPNLKHPDSVTWIRVGEERRGGWKGENFKPDKLDLEQMLAGRQGRFYIRVYDENVDLLDSTDFRYLRDLRKILINGELYTQNMALAPCPNKGYSPIKLQFIDANGDIHPGVKILDNPYVDVQPDGIVIVDPHPEADKVVCSLSFDKGQANVTINLPRIWWRLEKGGQML